MLPCADASGCVCNASNNVFTVSHGSSLPADSEVHRGILEGHTDSVWDLVVHPSTGLLASSSADGSCILWDPQLSSPQVRTFGPDEGKEGDGEVS